LIVPVPGVPSAYTTSNSLLSGVVLFDRTIVADLVADAAVGAVDAVLPVAIKPEPVNSTVIEHVPEPEIVVQML